MAERADVIASAIAYRQAKERQRQAGQSHQRPFEDDRPGFDDGQRNGWDDPNPPGVMEFVAGADYAGNTIPTRQFIDTARLLPQRQVILLNGDGGVGKSLLALQLAVAVASGTPWIGLTVATGPVIYLSAEDDRDELHMRLVEICTAEGVDLAGLHTLYTVPMAGKNAVLAQEQRNGGMRPTDLFDELEREVAARSPVLVTLDNLADTYSGNENNRSSAQQFIGMLRGLAMRHDTTVLLLGHPSLSGRASGTGESGSTAWNNSVRSRLYLQVPEGVDALDQPDLRLLEAKKGNYAPRGGRFSLKWVDGRFIREDAPSCWGRITPRDLELVQQAFAPPAKWRVDERATEWGGYKVAEIVDFDVGMGIAKSKRTAHQERDRDDVKTYLAGWLRAKSIHMIDGLGPDRKPAKFYSNGRD